LTAVNLNDLKLVTVFFAQGNQLVTIDMNDLKVLEHFDLSQNPALLHIMLKNGMSYSSFSFLAFPDSGVLQYICADVQNIATFNYLLTWTNLPPNSVQVNEYCNFVPGGDYNTITGTLHFDAASNGCDAGDATVKNIRLNMANSATFTSDSGVYNFYVPAGSHTVQPVFENTFFTTDPATATINFVSNGGTVTTQDFCVVANGNHPDVEVNIIPIERIRPGFSGVYAIIYKNKGNQVVSGMADFQYEFTKPQFTASTPVLNSQLDGL